MVSTSLLHNRAYQYSAAKVYVFSDSVEKIQWYSDNNLFIELNRIDGQPVEFEMEAFPRIHYRILNQIQQMMGELQCEPENFTGKMIFMSMFNDIMWDNGELCENNSKTIWQYVRRFPRGHCLSYGLDLKRSGTGTYVCKPDGTWDRTAEKMLLNFAGSGHPILRGTSALQRGELRSKGSGKKSIHFNGSRQNIVLLLQMVVSVNELSI